MDQPALFFNGIYIYWHGIFITIAIIAAVGTALLLSKLLQHNKTLLLFDTALLAFPLSFVCSRVLYHINNYDEFHSVAEALTFSDGGYALYGVVLGAFLAAVTMRFWRKDYPLGAVCDCMAAGGVVGIVIGRFAAYCSLDNVGIVMTSKKTHFFPLSVYDKTTGLWSLATFNMEAVTELAVFVLLCVMFVLFHNENRKVRGKNGDIALLFLMLHGASEVVFDSMQQDALKFPGNSFVRIQQIIGALSLAAVMTVFVIRSVKRAEEFTRFHLFMLIGFWGAIGLAAYMEFARISDTNYFRNHIVMFLCMVAASVLGVIMYTTSLRPEYEPPYTTRIYF